LPHPAGRISYGNSIGFQVNCPGATSIEMQQFGRRVGQIQGPKGIIQIPTGLLGFGHVTLVPVANLPSGTAQVLGVPIEFDIDPASPNYREFRRIGETLAPGLSLSIEGGPQVVAKDTYDPSWLSNFAKGPSQHFTLSGEFSVPKDDLYQLQVKTNTGATVQVGGVTVLSATDDAQHLAPLWLKTGRHRLQVVGIAPEHALLDIRLGAAGALHLAEGQFKHVVQ